MKRFALNSEYPDFDTERYSAAFAVLMTRELDKENV